MFKAVIYNHENVKAFLKTVPRGAKRAALAPIAFYVMGNESHGLKHDEIYRKVTRKSVYGKSFFTLRQLRFFFFALRKGLIKVPYRRTGRQSKSWDVDLSNLDRPIIYSLDPTVKWTRGQTRLHQRMGRLKI